MAYEKIFFPWIFFQKKQYGGCLHEHFVKLVDAVLFLKGVKMIKRNASKFYKTIAESIVWRALGFDEQKQLTNKKIDPKQIVFDTLSKYISQQHDLKLFVLNAKYNLSKKPVSVKDFFNSKHVEQSSGNKIVMDFVTKRNKEGKEDLEPGHFYYYVLTHQDPKVNIGRKMRLVSDFIETDAIDKLYYFKSLKDICTSFFACTAKDAEKQIEAFNKEQTNSFKQLTLDFNPSSPLKKKNSTDPISIQKRTKFASSNNGESSSKTKENIP
ncbi:DNA/RNA polymerase [Gigaspora margarita]|uniref:DNA-directed DNA polymerase n=1 Tax=Gigaspora margarita TaxID=4874 RepID=A0A8H4A081_GIGMA|nr:DNA/RNA polymerase [Gigaspora margarita]